MVTLLVVLAAGCVLGATIGGAVGIYGMTAGESDAPVFWGWGSCAALCIAAAILGSAAAQAHNEDRKSARGRGDTSVEHIDGTPAWVLEMPDEFSNVATKCVWAGYRGFTTTHDGGMAVVPDASCPMPAFAGPSR